jgi:hypothetical protein
MMLRKNRLMIILFGVEISFPEIKVFPMMSIRIIEQ